MTTKTKTKTKSFYWSLSLVFLTTSIVSPREENFYNIFTQDKIFLDIDKIKRLAESKNGTHTYYNTTKINNIKVFNDYWVDLENNRDANIYHMLSDSYRKTAAIKLKFQFPFYGRLLNSTRISTGGFLCLGKHFNSWLAAIQYIAPLWADFDLSSSNYSNIYYMDNGTALTVTWHNVTLHERPKVEGFTFQTTLHSNGNIIFAYKNVPSKIKEINSINFPVKIGISDAYASNEIMYHARRTIMHQHHTTFHEDEVTNGTVIILTAVPTCLQRKNCSSCVKKDTNIQCFWCDNLCSSGVDRNRQDWLKKDCDNLKVVNEDMCTSRVTTVTPPTDDNSKEPVASSSNNSTNNLPETEEPVASTSNNFTSSPLPANLNTLSPIITPEDIRPLPKAPQRKAGRTNPRKRHTAILTDTPEKEKLEKQKQERQAKKSSGSKKRQSKTIKLAKKKLILNDDEEDDTMCLVCCELFSSSRPKEKWVQCVKCKNWSHEACTSQEDRYICQHCDSDDDID
ncbi:hypothetical protein ACI65C_003807 [Semiaphis heraclei]